MRFVLLLLCLSGFGKQLDVEVRAKSAILMNAETGAILFEKHAHIPCFPASTTKIATALFVLDQGIDLEKIATVSADCLKQRGSDSSHPYWIDHDGTVMGLKRGEALTIDSLLHGLLLVSGNDAANTIAESVGGSVGGFVDLLNEYLQSIGCKGTQFSNPHGLSHPEHYSTAYDLALITRKALQFPKFRQLVRTLSYTKPKSNKQPEREIKLTCAMMKPNSRYYYPKAIGGKTGFTASAKNTFVVAAEQEGRTLIAVLLGCEKSGDRYEDAKLLFEKAFAEGKQKRRLLGPENVFKQEVRGSKTPLKASVPKGVLIEYFPSEEPECKAALHWNCAHLPIRKGQKVGEVQILDRGGRLLQKEDLIALEEVKGSLLFTLKDKLTRFFE
jgi:D-alanyl-D-alanine carboxypeptidase (penicillin-binding protein 5/6)